MIREKELRVIDSDGTQLGIISRDEALGIAEEKGMDLVLVSMDSKPSVAKIMDFGRFKFEQEKRIKEARKKQKETKVKEIQLTVGIAHAVHSCSRIYTGNPQFTEISLSELSALIGRRHSAHYRTFCCSELFASCTEVTFRKL